MKILLTGAKGQLGSCLQDRLQTNGELNYLALSSSELDITDAVAVEKTIGDYQPDVVVNAAAYTAVDKAESEPEMASRINEAGAGNLAQSCAKHGTILIHVSTDYVFDGRANQPYKETDATSPIGAYGKTKLAGEQVIAKLCPKHIILRTAWVYSEYGQNFAKTMLRLAATRDELNVVEDQVGCPTYAGDIADAILDICLSLSAKTVWGVYHYVGATQCNWAEFARRIFAEAGRMELLKQEVRVNGIPTSEYPTPAERPKYSVLDCAKISEHFGVLPVPLEQSLPRVLNALAALESKAANEPNKE